MGPAQRLPGFPDGFAFSLLPFWGDYCLVDFMLANVGAGTGTEVTIVLDDATRSAAIGLAGRWKKQVARVHVLESGIGELARMVDASSAEHVLFASLSAVSVLDAGQLLSRAAETGPEVVKISLANTPIEMYCARRDKAVAILEAAAARATGRGRLREVLFEGALHSAIDLIEDLPGDLLFQNDIMEYYANNIWLAANAMSARFHRTIARLPELADRGVESRIAEKASVSGCWLASGVEVEGSAEGSILFPRVVIRRGAFVSRSVILNGNRIGAGSEISGTLVLPCAAEAARPGANIGENCSIGAKSSTMKNADFPAQIREGLTVIGANAEIPNGFRAEAASYLAPGIPAATLRRMKTLRRGCSVLDGSEGSPQRAMAAAERAR